MRALVAFLLSLGILGAAYGVVGGLRSQVRALEARIVALDAQVTRLDQALTAEGVRSRAADGTIAGAVADVHKRLRRFEREIPLETGR